FLEKSKMKVGVIGYGSLGQYLVDFIEKSEEMELEFIWNRSKDKLGRFGKELILENLTDLSKKSANLIVEVAHPNITREFGELILSVADFFIGSPTALSDQKTENALRKAADEYKHGLYVPSGAFWGAQDIQKMAKSGSLSALKVTMTKHPSAFRLCSEELIGLNKKAMVAPEPVVLYEGPVRDLCPIAPNNVNTMAAAAIAASNLGFDQVIGCLKADQTSLDWHIVEVEVTGAATASGNKFSVNTTRRNPADPGVVTGSATFASFRESLLLAQNRGPGVHMC
uniref:Aspartate dehydrogenase domain-containing protein n=1 Tax=Ciona savignyi TaxID=51511 RepID=H2Z9T7_CIOSA